MAGSRNHIVETIWTQRVFHKQCGHANGVLTVEVKDRCLIEVSRIPARLIRCYLQYIHASRNPRSAFRLCRLVEPGYARRVLVVVVAPALIFGHDGHFSWQARVFWWSKVDFL